MMRATASVMGAGTDRQFRLGDGRRLGCAEYGDPHGRPVFYFHGFPSSRLEARLADRTAARLGVRLIAVDRPGFGLSDPRPGRRFGDWPDDVLGLAALLGLKRFAVLGVSGGGPYALACAWKIPQHLTAAGVVGGIGPGAMRAVADALPRGLRFGVRLSRYWPPLADVFLAGMALGVRFFPEALFSYFTSRVAEPDREVLAQAEVHATLLAAARESFRQGSAAAACELRLHLRPWDFRLHDIAMEVRLWHAERDAVVPVGVGRDQVARLPNCQARFYPEEGHFSLPVGHMEEILSALVI